MATRWLVDPLTRSEEQVAVLVMEGLRNTEIGERLGISLRTVESHLTRSFQKLGVRSRTELALAMAETRVSHALPPVIERCWRCHAHLGGAATVA